MTTDASTSQSWALSRARLRDRIGDKAFACWFGRLALDRLDGGEAHLSVPTKFLRVWLQRNYEGIILDTLATEFPALRHVSIEVRSARPEPKPIKQQPAPPAPAPTLIGSPLNSRLTFSNFQLADSNMLAGVEAMRAACAIRPTYNPLYFHAGPGLGKTHLLQAVAHAAFDQCRVLYITSERLSALGTLLKDLGVDSIFSSISVVIIDDIQFITRQSSKSLFYRVVDFFLTSARQIVMAADRPPNELEWIDESCRSRLNGGLCVKIGAPEHDLRVKIINARIAGAKLVHQIDIAPHVIDYVASTIQTSGRDLEGGVNRLIAQAAYNHQSPGTVTMEMADLAIRDLVRTPDPKKVKIEDIQKLVASHFNVSRDDILSARRTANVVHPRQIAMYLCKLLTPRSLPEIGRKFGNRDHTTILHAMRKITGLVAADPVLAEEISVLSKVLLS